MDKELQEVKEVTQSLMPQAGEMLSLEKTVENAERYFKALERIRKLSVNVTNVLDWVDEAGKPYAQKSACDKIAGAFGVQTGSPEFEKENLSDEKGDYYVYSCKIAGRWNNVEASEVGVASSRDDFFALRTITNAAGEKEKVLKPQSEIDPCDIRKKAFTNGMNRLIKRLLGLSFTWEEIEQISGGKISRQLCAGVQYSKGSKGGNADSPQTKTLREECRKWILQLCDDSEAAAKAFLKKETAFKGRDGTDFSGKENIASLSEKQIEILHGKVKKLIEKNNASAPPTPQPVPAEGANNALPY